MNEQDFVDLAKDCSNLCKVLKDGTQGRSVDSLSSEVIQAIEDMNM